MVIAGVNGPLALRRLPDASKRSVLPLTQRISDVVLNITVKLCLDIIVNIVVQLMVPITVMPNMLPHFHITLERRGKHRIIPWAEEGAFQFSLTRFLHNCHNC
mmetsp:Transcript_26090/g.60192  ORF Transcript_26090/g.60192 Transcript_26090/m.60192 type:complete len:103 (-) Transcript_26090:109-417(-)